MKEIIYYEAEDGTRFEDECECLEYEQKSQATEIGDDLQMWDAEGNEVYDVCEAFYIRIKSPKALNFYNELANYWGVDRISLVGEFIWGGHYWSSIEDYVRDVAVFGYKITKEEDNE